MQNFGIRNQNLECCACRLHLEHLCLLAFSVVKARGKYTRQTCVHICTCTWVHIYMHTQYTHNACVHIYMCVFIQILILESMCHTEASSSSHSLFLASQHFIFTSSWVRTTATNVNTFTNLFNPITIAKMASELLPLYAYQREFTFCLLFSSLLP